MTPRLSGGMILAATAQNAKPSTALAMFDDAIDPASRYKRVKPKRDEDSGIARIVTVEHQRLIAQSAHGCNPLQHWPTRA